MSTIILDFGSGNSCLNDKSIVKKMYDELSKVDTGKHKIICKWQLFLEAGNNIPLDRDVFYFAYKYGNELGYKVTSSIFDKESLDFLLQFDPCFVKIANNRKLDWLIGEVPRKIPVYISSDNPAYRMNVSGPDRILMACVSDYPAQFEDYKNQGLRQRGYISDHTANFDLWYEFKPDIVEWHYGLEDSTGLDTGPFMRTPAMLKEIL
jgi:sialic acid synthase SpsE